MPRFFIEKMNTCNPEITGADARHIGRSLRMKIGEALTVCASGTDYNCKIKSISDEKVLLDILSAEYCAAEPTIELTLFQAVPKGDKFEQIIQKSVELGVTGIVPVLSRRCVSRPTEKDFEKKLIRYNKIALEAAKQSGRGIIPKVADPLNFTEAITKMKEYDCPCMLYEEFGGKSFCELKTDGKKSYALMIGSEGGFDASEAAAACESGINMIWLGKRILRCETAPITAISVLMHITKNL